MQATSRKVAPVYYVREKNHQSHMSYTTFFRVLRKNALSCVKGMNEIQSKIFADVIDGSPQTLCSLHAIGPYCICTAQ